MGRCPCCLRRRDRETCCERCCRELLRCVGVPFLSQGGRRVFSNMVGLGDDALVRPDRYARAGVRVACWSYECDKAARRDGDEGAKR